MLTSLASIKRVVYGDYRPWLLRNTSVNRFNALYRELPVVKPHTALHYQLVFPAALGAKRMFYQKFIANSIIASINELDELMESSSNQNEKKYHIHTLLGSVMPEYYQRLRQLLKDNDYSTFAFMPADGIIPQNEPADESYILYYLKHQLIRLYLETSCLYQTFIKAPVYAHDELYALYFEETPPQPPVVQQVSINSEN